jgi:hypothetical protein
MLIWWISDFKRVRPHAVGRVELAGMILRGDLAHPEIPDIRRAQFARVAGPVVIARGLAARHAEALAARYRVDVAESSRARSRTWVQAVPADLRVIAGDGTPGPAAPG